MEFLLGICGLKNELGIMVGCYCVYSKQVPDEEGLSKLKMISRNLKGNVFFTNNVDGGTNDNQGNDGSGEISDDNSTLKDEQSDNELSDNEIGDIETSDHETLNETEEEESPYDQFIDTQMVNILRVMWMKIDQLTAECEARKCTDENDDRCKEPNSDQPICSPCNVSVGKCTYVPPATMPPRPTPKGETEQE